MAAFLQQVTTNIQDYKIKMKKLYYSRIFFPFFGLLAAGDVPALSTFRDVGTDTENPVVFFESFEGDLSSRWQVPSSVKIQAGEGVTGSRALVLSRTKENVTDYKRAMVRCNLKLTPGKYYRISASYRTEGVKDGLRVGTIISVKPDQDVAVTYPQQFPDNSTDWKSTYIDFRAGELNQVTICLWWDVEGKAFWDDIKVEEQVSNSGALYACEPQSLRLNDDGTVELKGALWGKNDISGYAVILETAGKRFMEKFDKNSKVKFSLGRLPGGKYECKACIADLTSKTLLVKRTFTLFRDPAAKPVHGSVCFDRDGLPLLNGKTFFPIGIFVSHLRSEADLKRIADGGFNFILHYRSFDLNIQKGLAVPPLPEKLQGSPDPKRNTDPVWNKQTRESLDLIRKHALYYIPTWGGEPDVFQHPAVIARYTADEVPVTRIPALQKQRERISERNPFHPVIALTNRPADFFAYARIADIVGFDNYPVEGKNDKSRSMLRMRNALIKAQEAGLRVMFVPQAFNWGAFRPAKNYKNFSYPTEEEIRSMTLLPVIFGVRWFCFYHYDVLFDKQEKMDPGSSHQSWKNLTNAVQMLKRLQPWLFSTEPAGKIKVVSHTGATVDAKAFRKNGKLCVVITACGPGKSGAFLNVGKNGLKSQYGRTESYGDGTYRFTGNGISSDILIEP